MVFGKEELTLRTFAAHKTQQCSLLKAEIDMELRDGEGKRLCPIVIKKMTTQLNIKLKKQIRFAFKICIVLA